MNRRRTTKVNTTTRTVHSLWSGRRVGTETTRTVEVFENGRRVHVRTEKRRSRQG